MRILRVAQKCYPDLFGGGTYHIHALSRDQAAMGHDVTVLTVRHDATLSQTEVRDGYCIVRQPSTVEVLGNDISVGVARSLRQAGDFDVVHAHSHLYASTNLAALAARVSDVPLAITNHGLFSQSARESLFDAYLRTLGRWTFDAAEVVFCYTETDRDRLRAYGVSAPISVVANGIDTDRFTPTGQTTDRVDGDPAIVFAGRLVEGKRPCDAVEAVARLRERRPGATLTICGEGPRSGDVAQRATTLGVADAVTLLGRVSYDEMASVYRSADALVLPSRAEGLPRTVLEALACDVPVVTSDLDQLSRLVCGVGETAAIGDIEGFTAALDRVVDGTPREPRTVVTGEYNWSSTVAETTAILERLATGG